MGMGGPLGGSLPGGQPSTPNLNPPSQIDPSSIERAYAALGLTYQGNQAANQNQQTSVPTQPGMRPLNSMGECDVSDFECVTGVRLCLWMQRTHK